MFCVLGTSIDNRTRSILIFKKTALDHFLWKNFLINFSWREPFWTTFSSLANVLPKILNYKRALQNLNINDLKAKPPSCSCTISPHCYQPAGHIITGDLSIVSSDTLRGLLTKGPKYRPPRSINWTFQTVDGFCWGLCTEMG